MTHKKIRLLSFFNDRPQGLSVPQGLCVPTTNRSRAKFHSRSSRSDEGNALLNKKVKRRKE